jgi:hypothetical protein
MTFDERNKLRKLAREASSGPWVAEHGDEDDRVLTIHGGINMGLLFVAGNPAYPTEQDTRNANYICALSPERLLELLDDLECTDALVRTMAGPWAASAHDPEERARRRQVVDRWRSEET